VPLLPRVSSSSDIFKPNWSCPICEVSFSWLKSSHLESPVAREHAGRRLAVLNSTPTSLEPATSLSLAVALF
jgi:hypothetical protein